MKATIYWLRAKLLVWKVVVLAMKGIGYEYELLFWQQHKSGGNQQTMA
jgi:predicted membrane protein